ncbi:hypothetical protein [Streptomyces sp. R35]|uniref:Glycoside hydrolase family 3 C-terminal domain-containing protein n=1 Tax=Streptomyces sp. R35 TaxID=3238630 RepID=A0AB39S7X5_9ACTN
MGRASAPVPPAPGRTPRLSGSRTWASGVGRPRQSRPHLPALRAEQPRPLIGLYGRFGDGGVAADSVFGRIGGPALHEEAHALAPVGDEAPDGFEDGCHLQSEPPARGDDLAGREFVQAQTQAEQIGHQLPLLLVVCGGPILSS